MKKITLVTILTLTATAFSFSTVKANTIEPTSTDVAVTAIEGEATFNFGAVSPLNLNFSDITFDQSGSANTLTEELPLPTGSLENRSFGETTVEVSVTASGAGLTISEENAGYTLTAQQGTSATQTDAKVTVNLDPLLYDNEAKDDYKVTVTATEVTPQTPES